MRSSLALVLLAPLSACLEGDVALFGCPPDEVCSNNTPNGLLFFGANLAGTNALGNSSTAVGGTQRVALKEKVNETTFVPLEADYVAIGGAAVAVEARTDHVITLRGQAIGGNDIVIRDADDDSLMDRKTFHAAELASISIAGEQPESTSELPAAFLPGTIRIGIALAAEAGGRLVDESMTIELPGAVRVQWDVVELSGAEPGTIPVTVAAADKPAVTLDVPVVAQADAIAETLVAEDGLVVGEFGMVCFHAVAGGTHRVVNLDWQIEGTNGTQESFLSENCAFVVPETAGELTITASAGGLTHVVTYPVAEAPRAKPKAPAGSPHAGERAARVATAAASRSR